MLWPLRLVERAGCLLIITGKMGVGVSSPAARLEIGGTESAGIPAIDISTYAADVTDTSDIVLSPNGVIGAS